MHSLLGILLWFGNISLYSSRRNSGNCHIAIRTTEMGALTFTEHFVPLTSQTLAQFFVDSETSAYYSTLNQLHLRNILITKYFLYF